MPLTGRAVVATLLVAAVAAVGQQTTVTVTPAGTRHELVRVPAGSFTMGSDAGRSDELPVHEVDLDAFDIDRFEVTNAQYLAFVEATRRTPPYYAGDAALEGPQQPVVGVHWFDAEAYCAWAGLRLPTEAEWEKAARGPDGRTYPWGEGIDAGRANYLDGGPGRPAAVGSHPLGASPYGVQDLTGNVWEWVADLYDAGYYADSPARNPPGSQHGSSRVIRGGSWRNSAANLRSARRGWMGAPDLAEHVGFRCAGDAPAPDTAVIPEAWARLKALCPSRLRCGR